MLYTRFIRNSGLRISRYFLCSFQGSRVSVQFTDIRIFGLFFRSPFLIHILIITSYSNSWVSQSLSLSLSSSLYPTQHRLFSSCFRILLIWHLIIIFTVDFKSRIQSCWRCRWYLYLICSIIIFKLNSKNINSFSLLLRCFLCCVIFSEKSFFICPVLCVICSLQL